MKNFFIYLISGFALAVIALIPAVRSTALATEELWYRCSYLAPLDQANNELKENTAGWKKFSAGNHLCYAEVNSSGKALMYLQFGKNNPTGGGELRTPIYQLDFTYNAVATLTPTPSLTPAAGGATATGTQATATPTTGAAATSTPPATAGPTATTAPTSTPAPTATPTLPAEKVKFDLNGDHVIDKKDADKFVEIWNSGVNLTIIDFDGNGRVDAFDWTLLLANFTK